MDDPQLMYYEGFVSEQEGRHEEALAWFLKASASLDNDRRKLRDDGARSSFTASRNVIYEAAALQLLQFKRYAEALEMVERTRSRVLSDLLVNRPPLSVKSLNGALFAEAVALRQRIGAGQSQLFSFAGLDPARRTEANFAAIQQGLRGYEAKYQTLLDRMAAEAPSLYALAATPKIDHAALKQAMLDEGFEMLQYMMTPTGLVVWHTSAEGSVARKVIVTKTQLTATLAVLTASLRDRQTPFNEAAARELFLFLIEPVLSNLKTKRLLILPSQDVGNLPFQVLINPDDGRFLGERFQISYAPSATVLLALKRAGPLKSPRVLALADPTLPAAVDEIESIRKVLGGRGRFSAKHKPSEADVKRSVADADVVHLAVHGSFSRSDPMLSALALDGGEGEDGQLTAIEMFGLNLRKHPLVVLSACQTGVTGTKAAGESLGMSRALIFAGANALLLSQWEVDSIATARWMQAFYRYATTNPLDLSAKLAADEIRADPATRHPFYWAPFLLTAR